MAIHSNKLKKESSPYLLQHAGNPVHWFAWGSEALAAAKVEDKPILVSIGYAACHWCHVMEKESFENEEIAALMNEHFINIKIDREERPDLDHIYMDAVQAIAGNGGWPLNVFLTPDAKPFFGGTYFPPQKAFNRPSWTDVLLQINDSWKNRRNEVEDQAEQLIDHIKKSNSFGTVKNIIPAVTDENIFDKETCKAIAGNLLKNADTIDGGFGNAPKFPQTFSLQYLLHYYWHFNDTAALQQVELSLQKMLNGGIYDQLGGGLCRYSTDGQWLAPHFEKMLYDNALLLNVLCDAYQITKNKFYGDAIKNILNFISREMKDKNGGYYAAIDADSEGMEGKFYTWKKSEIEELLQEKSLAFCTYYNICEAGNWEGVNILNITKTPEEVAEQFNLSLDDFKSLIIACKKILFEERNKRIRPITDDKILIGWNALLLRAFCNAYAALQEKTYKVAAIELFNFIETVFVNKKEKSLFHTYKEGIAKHPAFLDDYAYYIQACIALQEITGNQDYLFRAKELTEFVDIQFTDTDSNFLFFTGQFQNDVVVRKIELYDGAIPSANAVMLHNYLYLSIVFDKKDWQEKAVKMLSTIVEVVKKHPGSFGVWAIGYLNLTIGINQIAILGNNVNTILTELLSNFLPAIVLQSTEKLSDMPLLAGKNIYNESLIYICQGHKCYQPVKSVAETQLLIKKSDTIIQ